MRVVEVINDQGEVDYAIDDSPMVVRGVDAERILAQMLEPPSEERLRQEAECIAIYERNMAMLKRGP